MRIKEDLAFLKRNAKDWKNMCYVFQILKGSNCPPRLLCPEELKGNFFMVKHKLKGFMITNVVQNKILEGVLYIKETNNHIHAAKE